MDQGVVEIAHVTVAVRRPEKWRQFLDVVTDGQARVDWADAPAPTGPRRQALRLQSGPSDDIVCLGLGWRSEPGFDAMLARLARRGLAPRHAERPGALRAATCTDPAGHALELLLLDPHEAADASWPIGHVALSHQDPEMLSAFYADTIGFRLNETLLTKLGPIELRGGFLGSARWHHSLAVLNVPGRRRLDHVMFGADSVAEVARMNDRTQHAGVPFSLELGQHPMPDGTVSFYAASPSGWDVEIGAGAPVFAAADAPGESDTPSIWGHRPTLRKRLRIVGALALDKVGLG